MLQLCSTMPKRCSNERLFPTQTLLCLLVVIEMLQAPFLALQLQLLHEVCPETILLKSEPTTAPGRPM